MDLLTAGASRALARASQLALDDGARTAEPRHLLLALWAEESRAADLLAQHGLAEAELSGVPVAGDEGDEAAGDSARELVAGVPPPGSALELVIHAAGRQARSATRSGEAGSEHLLWGLLATVPAVAELLARYGLTADSLLERIAERAGSSTAPIPSEVALRWREAEPTDRHDGLRILDAAANRLREGLRVVEDYVRMTLDDRHLTQQLKDWRHRFSQAMSLVDDAHLLAARDTFRDVGTRVSTLTEQSRAGLLDVVRANFKRTTEAARTVEEYGKVLSPLLGERVEQLRYGLYTLEKAVLQTAAMLQRFEGQQLYLVATEDLCHHGSGPAIRGALAGGVRIVQVREKMMQDRRLVEHGRRVREWTRAAGAVFIMNDRPDLAVLTDADGVHVGQEELSVREVRRIIGPDKLVGVSTHTLEQARQAVLDGADYIGVGPVFPTKTKSFATYAGLEFVRQVAAEIRLPAFSIGGISAANIESVRAAGASRVAVSSAVCCAEDPEAAARTLVESLRA